MFVNLLQNVFVNLLLNFLRLQVRLNFTLWLERRGSHAIRLSYVHHQFLSMNLGFWNVLENLLYLFIRIYVYRVYAGRFNQKFRSGNLVYIFKNFHKDLDLGSAININYS